MNRRRGAQFSRRTFLALAGGATLSFRPGNLVASNAEHGFHHGFSPLGPPAYPEGFDAFRYVNADAPKGGVLRLVRIGAFDTADTLHYPGLPAGDIRTIYDHLIVPSEDETASYYGLLARAFRVSPGYDRIDFILDERARWHDGTPITARDVAFSFETLKTEGAPFYRQAFRPLSVRVEGDNRATVLNTRLGDRDLIRRIATIPIHPAHHWQGRSRSAAGAAPLGSGPYRLVDVDPPRRVVLERVPEWWASNNGTSRGRWNFDRIEIEYFRDQTIALEAFRAGDVDVIDENDPTRWATGYRGPQFDAGRARTRATEAAGAGTLNGLVFNMRQPLLADRRVRLALALAWDFDAANRTLFSGGYQPFDSVFGETELAARGQATSAERQLLEAAGVEPEAALLEDPDPLSGLPAPGSREALAAATALLDDAGLRVAGTSRIRPDTGEPVRLTVVSPNPLYDRPLGWLQRTTARLGVELVPVQADPAAASRRMLDRDFDLAALSWAPVRLPGTAERLLWHSDLADLPNTYALAGLKSRAVDASIEALEIAASPSGLASAAHAFDRAWRDAIPMLPLWRSNTVRIAYWDRFGQPEAEGVTPSPIDQWWPLSSVVD